MKPRHLLIAVAAIAAAVGGWVASGWRHQTASQAQTSAGLPEAAGDTLLQSSFPDLNNQRQALSQWRNKILVVNFWATWCPPCRAEIPAFIEMQRDYADKNVKFVGIAIDNADNVNDFARQLGINYPLLLGEEGGFELIRKLGNLAGVLPFTLVVGPGGRVVMRHLGGLEADQLKPVLSSLIADS